MSNRFAWVAQNFVLGPFVMNSKEEIDKTFMDYKQGINGFENFKRKLDSLLDPNSSCWSVWWVINAINQQLQLRLSRVVPDQLGKCCAVLHVKWMPFDVGQYIRSLKWVLKLLPSLYFCLLLFCVRENLGLKIIALVLLLTKINWNFRQHKLNCTDEQSSTTQVFKETTLLPAYIRVV